MPAGTGATLEGWSEGVGGRPEPGEEREGQGHGRDIQSGNFLLNLAELSSPESKFQGGRREHMSPA